MNGDAWHKEDDSRLTQFSFADNMRICTAGLESKPELKQQIFGHKSMAAINQEYKGFLPVFWTLVEEGHHETDSQSFEEPSDSDFHDEL